MPPTRNSCTCAKLQAPTLQRCAGGMSCRGARLPRGNCVVRRMLRGCVMLMHAMGEVTLVRSNNTLSSAVCFSTTKGSSDAGDTCSSRGNESGHKKLLFVQPVSPFSFLDPDPFTRGHQQQAHLENRLEQRSRRHGFGRDGMRRQRHAHQHHARRQSPLHRIMQAGSYVKADGAMQNNKYACLWGWAL